MRTPTEQSRPADPDSPNRRPAPVAGCQVVRRRATHRQPSVLTRFATWALGIEAMLLVALGVAGTGRSAAPAAAAGTVTAQTPTEVLGFRMNPAHSLLLLATGLLALAALWHPTWLRRFAAAQTIGYLLLFVFGLAYAANTPTATMWNLNAPDHVLHAVLFGLGLTLMLMLYSSSSGRSGTADGAESSREAAPARDAELSRDSAAPERG
jgi:NADH:ubiquinone oxidoreductase subunit 6 (subunit J)